MTIQKTWAAVEGDEIVEEGDTRDELERKLGDHDHEIVALPKRKVGLIL